MQLNNYEPEFLAHRIKTLREFRGKTQIQVANCINVSRRTYIDIESNKSDIKLSTLYRICNCLKCEITDVLGISKKDNDSAMGNRIIEIFENNGLMVVNNSK
ncbi:helix-turn-helix transcriptional regulator [Photobacterium sp. BZF1]|uniref:helix-turn-helix transcriptional regulator n=1 Tax=Photobacterium sp. BZF1 TaxID=1904457 RepID=UPI00165367FA|nr:helix-turn-helix transcriptional regulator [Photobacterium sp. BZF1]